MKYKEIGFRAVYHRFCCFALNDDIRKVIDPLPGADQANGILTYGYYDREAGITLEVLACAIIEDGRFRYAPGNPEVSLKVRIESAEELEVLVASDDDGAMAEEFSGKLEMLKAYDVSEEIERTREMTFLDQSRDEHFIDDVKVRLVKDDLQTEECWVRIIGLEEKDHFFMGTLLNEPYQDFGWHEGERIAFFVQKSEDDSIFCFTDMNPSKKITEEDLADGSMLKEAVRTFNGDRNERNFIDVLVILRDSWVWVPCTAVLSDEDNKAVEDMLENAKEDPTQLVGMTLTTKDQVRLVPDILENDGDLYFPIFSTEEEMGEYGNNFSKVAQRLVDVIPLARNNEKELKGIVLNAFSEPFVLEAVLFDLVENMKSRT